jgi:uncharacterized protein (TIGR04255 family)
MPSYKRPILVEMVAQMRFVPGVISGAQVVDAAALLRNRGFESADLELQADGGAGETAQLAPTVRLWSADRSRLVQLRPRTFIANIVGDYPGWKQFGEHLRETLDVLKAIGVTTAAESVSLATIDRFTVLGAGFRLGEYLAADGVWLPKALADVAEPCDLTLGRGVLHLSGRNRVVKVAVRQLDEAKVQVTLECVFANSLPKDSDVESAFEELHDEALVLFEQLITDKTRNVVMQGVKA